MIDSEWCLDIDIETTINDQLMLHLYVTLCSFSPTVCSYQVLND